MEKSEAVSIIESLIHSLKTEPGQFNIELKVVGQTVSVTNGGIGQINAVTGGAAGSTTIGNKVVVDGSSVEIARARAGQALDAQMSGLVDALEKVAAEFRSEKPDKGVIQSVIKAIGESWVPPLITGVVKTVAGIFS
ncbi:hypothetical protein RAM80_06400 [Pseudomonas sp. App30]|uniref:hypothetical protein n=1 Tax=Pseudomonas sp. App30 TaxID=3068990 RepID=UPI003A7F6902